MRAAGTIVKKREARRFADYLLTEGIAVQLTRADAGWTVWVIEEELVGRVRAELTVFLREPGAARFACSRAAERIRADACEALSRATSRRTTLPGPRVSTPLAGALLVFAAVVALATAELPTDAPEVARLLIAGPDGEGLAELFTGEVWRLVTPIFVPAGPLDLLLGAVMIAGPGRRIEAAYGTAALAGLVLAFAIAGDLAQYMVSGPCPIGLSGVGVGLLAFAAVQARATRRASWRIGAAEAALVAIWLGACLSGLVSPVACAAIAVGLAGGVVAGSIAVRRARARA